MRVLHCPTDTGGHAWGLSRAERALGALGEIFGSAALLVEPGDEQGVAAAIDRVVRDERFRADLVRRGYALAATFSWVEAARRTRYELAQAARQR